MKQTKQTILITVLFIFGLSSCKNQTCESTENKSAINLTGDELKIVAEIYLKPDAFKSMKPIFEKVIAGSQAEEGCIYYDLHSDVTDTTNTKFMMLEVWKDQAAIDNHNQTPHYKNFSSVAKDYIDSLKVTVLQVSK